MKLASLIVIIFSAVGLIACQGQNDKDKDKDNDQNKPLTQATHKTELNGEQLFFVCQACHSIVAGAAHKTGPNLHGIANQPAASRQGYDYSPALSQSGLTWNKPTLMGWIMATENAVLGTFMLYHNHLSANEAQRLADYVLSQK